MTVKAGKDFLLKIGDGATPENFTTVGGLRSNSMKINSENIDITNIESLEWKETLANAGLKSMAISGSGVFTDSTTLDQIRNDMLAGTIRNFQLYENDTSKKWQGGFKILNIDRKADYNKEQSWTLSLESSGQVTYG